MSALPIVKKKQEIIAALRGNRVVIVTGETGCGKTTQLPIMLHEDGYSRKGIIAVAQPRRATAISVAEYVSEQIGTSLGDLVGYHVRFGNVSVDGTAIKFMTNGILLRETLSHELFERYSVLIIDEAHERSVETDILLGLAKRATRMRDDLRIVVASATLNVEAFQRYFESAPVIIVPGRQFQISTKYHRRDLPLINFMVRGVAKKIIKIVRDTKDGDILAFMPGRESIDGVISEIWRLGNERVVTLPFHKDMEVGEYKRVFEDFPGFRKIIVSTNIAETSLTIPSVKFVVDSGLIKEVDYDPEKDVQSLDVITHSQSGCMQRSGRAGRTEDGICFRMYTHQSFAERSIHRKPEILRRRLDGVCLYLRAIGFDDPRAFEFIDKPREVSVSQARHELINLGAISAQTGALTRVGELMAALPLSPRVSRLVAEAVKNGCVREMITYVSFLSSPRVFVLPWGSEAGARLAHKQFIIPNSDALTLINVWNSYVNVGYSKAWCEEHYLCSHALSETKLAREQLAQMLLDRHIGITSASSDGELLKTIVLPLKAGLLMRQGRGIYKGVFHDFGQVRLHPESSLRGRNADYIVAADIVKINRPYAIQCTEVPKDLMRSILPQTKTQVLQPTAKNETSESSAETDRPEDKTAEPEIDTLLFLKRERTLVAFYKGKLVGVRPQTTVPVPGKLYRCRISPNNGQLLAEILQEIETSTAKESGSRQPEPDANRLQKTRVSKISLPASEETVCLARDLASSWQCHLDSD